MKTLIFDCDGVLVDSEFLAEQTLETYLTHWLPDLDIPTLLGQALGMTTADILHHLEQQSRHALPADASEQVDEAIESRLLRELTAIEGVHRAVSGISLPKAIVSNSRRRRVEASRRPRDWPTYWETCPSSPPSRSTTRNQTRPFITWPRAGLAALLSSAWWWRIAWPE